MAHAPRRARDCAYDLTQNNRAETGSLCRNYFKRQQRVLIDVQLPLPYWAQKVEVNLLFRLLLRACPLQENSWTVLYTLPVLTINLLQFKPLQGSRRHFFVLGGGPRSFPSNNSCKSSTFFSPSASAAKKRSYTATP